jgi:hypothetical protein
LRLLEGNGRPQAIAEAPGLLGDRRGVEGPCCRRRGGCPSSSRLGRGGQPSRQRGRPRCDGSGRLPVQMQHGPNRSTPNPPARHRRVASPVRRFLGPATWAW